MNVSLTDRPWAVCSVCCCPWQRNCNFIIRTSSDPGSKTVRAVAIFVFIGVVSGWPISLSPQQPHPIYYPGRVSGFVCVWFMPSYNLHPGAWPRIYQWNQCKITDAVQWPWCIICRVHYYRALQRSNAHPVSKGKWSMESNVQTLDFTFFMFCRDAGQTSALGMSDA